MRIGLTDTIQHISGRRYRCHGWGKNKQGDDVKLLIQYNTDEVPKELELTDEQIRLAFENKIIKYC